MRRHGPWQILQSTDVYRDPWLSLQRDDVIRPDGAPGTYIVAHLKPGVSVLAIDEQENVFLTEEFHYGVGRVTIETVSGGVEPKEDALDTARRELREELGIVARRWTDLGSVDPFTANVVSPTRLFLAEELEFVGQQLEGTEQIRALKASLRDAVQMVLGSEITHGPSCVLILKAAFRLRQFDPVDPA